jgi:hypothetical protein
MPVATMPGRPQGPKPVTVIAGAQRAVFRVGALPGQPSNALLWLIGVLEVTVPAPATRP